MIITIHCVVLVSLFLPLPCLVYDLENSPSCSPDFDFNILVRNRREQSIQAPSGLVTHLASNFHNFVVLAVASVDDYLQKHLVL